jgi:hypothetical protein
LLGARHLGGQVVRRTGGEASIALDLTPPPVRSVLPRSGQPYHDPTRVLTPEPCGLTPAPLVITPCIRDAACLGHRLGSPLPLSLPGSDSPDGGGQYARDGRCHLLRQRVWLMPEPDLGIAIIVDSDLDRLAAGPFQARPYIRHTLRHVHFRGQSGGAQFGGKDAHGPGGGVRIGHHDSLLSIVGSCRRAVHADTPGTSLRATAPRMRAPPGVWRACGVCGRQAQTSTRPGGSRSSPVK